MPIVVCTENADLLEAASDILADEWDDAVGWLLHEARAKQLLLGFLRARVYDQHFVDVRDLADTLCEWPAHTHLQNLRLIAGHKLGIHDTIRDRTIVVGKVEVVPPSP